MNRWLARLWSSKSQNITRRSRPTPLRLEQLEDRLTPAPMTFTVLNANDSGSNSLRDAIISANSNSGMDTINFNIPGTGVPTINLLSALPTITNPVLIDGYSENNGTTSASANTLANGDNANILIQLNGAGAGAGADGLTLGAGSDGSTIKGLDVSNFSGNGIVVASDGNTVVGNFIGVNPAGTAQMTNSGDGIRVVNASNNTIGGTTPDARNVVSGNSLDGIHIEGLTTAAATGNIVQGNFVGVSASGVGSVGNTLFGIEVSGGNFNTIGGTAAGARNVVGFNADGIEIDNGGQSNVIQGNFVGVGADGVTPAGNVLHGIALRSDGSLAAPLGPGQPNEPGVSFNTIGGTVAGAGNLVEFNGSAGITVFGNPVSVSGQPNIGNAIEGNSVFENARSNPSTLIGIDLTNSFPYPKDDGATPNDSKGHGGPNDPNNFQNFPVLTSAVSGVASTTITGALHSAAGLTYRIEFFASNVDPLGGAAEGQQFLGFKTATTDANGNATFTTVLGFPVANGRITTATATDPLGNTSEFSAGIRLPTAASGANPAQFPLGFGSGTGGVESVVNLQANGQVVASPSPIPGWTGEVHRATGAFDGSVDTVWAAGPGGGPRVRIIGAGGAVLADFYAFAPGFTGGVNVAVGDVNHDGIPDLIVSAGPGGGPEVKVIDGTKLGQVMANGEIAPSALLADFYAFAPGFSGGVTVAAADFNGDGRADIVTGAGPGGGPEVKVVSGAKAGQILANGQISNAALLADFYAFAPAFTGGVNVAAGDFNGDSVPDLIVGAGAGGGPEVKVIDGTKLGLVQANGEIASNALFADFYAYNPAFTGGVTVDAADVNGDGKADVVTGAGPGGGPEVKVFRATDLAVLDDFYAQSPTFPSGVFV